MVTVHELCQHNKRICPCRTFARVIWLLWEKMLNLFVATGHINYAKSGRLYLQLMLDLEKNYPWLYHQFNDKGFHCIRRTDKFWTGLWTDLVIEQTAMLSIKSLGGLT